MIEEDETCSIFAIGPHENFYDLIKTRLKQVKALLAKVRVARKNKAEPKKKKAERKK